MREHSDEDLTIIDVGEEHVGSRSSSLTDSLTASLASIPSPVCSPPPKGAPPPPAATALVLPPGSAALDEFQEFLSARAPRQPVLCLVDHGLPGGQLSDMWVVPHNTLRRELFDTFEVVQHVAGLGARLTYGDVRELRAWWRFVTRMWALYTAHEDAAMAPLLARVVAIDGRCPGGGGAAAGLRAIADGREWLECKLRELSAYLEEFDSLPPARALVVFMAGVDRVAEKMVGWFAAKERLLPGLVEGYYTAEVAHAVEGSLVERLREAEWFEEGVVAMVRWMGCVQGFMARGGQSRERERFLVRNLSWAERVRLRAFYRKYDAVHGDVLKLFRRRAKEGAERAKS